MTILYLKLTFALALLAILIYYFKFKPLEIWSTLPVITNVENSNFKANKLFTSDSLKLYNGVDKPELYLTILGKVFDVTKGATHYGPGQTYNFFIGKDASRSFITGQFGSNDASDEVADLSSSELRSLNHWIQFYKKEYTRVGKLIGRYYQPNGKLTHYAKEVRKLIKKADVEEDLKQLEKQKYPPCNVEWDATQGSRVWCSDRSGGIKRDWIGVPRQLYEAGSKSYRCACVNSNENLGQLKEYDGCDSEAISCFIKDNN